MTLAVEIPPEDECYFNRGYSVSITTGVEVITIAAPGILSSLYVLANFFKLIFKN